MRHSKLFRQFWAVLLSSALVMGLTPNPAGAAGLTVAATATPTAFEGPALPATPGAAVPLTGHPAATTTDSALQVAVTVTAFEALPENIRRQNTAAPEFPAAVSGTAGGETVPIPVMTWEADHGYDPDRPAKVLYVFTAVPAAGYVLAAGVAAPRITVYIPVDGGPATGRRAALMAGGGTDSDPLEISTAAQLAEIAALVNERENGLELFLFNSAGARVTLKLIDDLDLSAYGPSNPAFNNGKGWVPIGSSENQFKSHFDGNGKVISGLSIHDDTLTGAGLFGVVGQGGVVQCLGLAGVNITAGSRVGGVAGQTWGTIRNCYVLGSVSGVDWIGGVVGQAGGATLKNCLTAARVESYIAAGGVAGGSTAAVEGCAALNPAVTGRINVGRVVGEGLFGSYDGNIAFGGMESTGAGDYRQDGIAATAAAINQEGFFQSVFRFAEGEEDPWQYAAGCLPGFAEPLPMPLHLRTVPAAPFAGQGNSGSPYEIGTAEQLVALAELVNSGEDGYNSSEVYYKLTDNIDLSGYRLGEGWIPIGKDNSHPFNGNLDGGGHVVSGLTIDRPGGEYLGLFGFLASGSAVRNLGVAGADITGEETIGVLAGAVSGTVENCWVAGRVAGTDEFIGGLAGSISGTVKNCYAAVAVSGSAEVGGVAGEVSGAVQNCWAAGSVTGTSQRVGGITGTIREDGKVENCVALNSSVGEAASVNRVVGQNYGDGNLSGNYAFAGMTVIRNGTSESVTDGTATNEKGQAKTAAELQEASFWTGGGFTDGGFAASAWQVENGKLPLLKDTADHLMPGQDATLPPHLLTGDAHPFDGGGGTSAADAYTISKPEQLAWLAERVNGGDSPYNADGVHYKLTQNIDLSAYASGKGWMPIGKSISVSFKGNLDGGGHVISGLTINRPGASVTEAVGLFGWVSGGTVQNLGLTGVNITGCSNVGGLAGLILGTVKNCYVTGSISGNDGVGGAVGYVATGTVESCYVAGSVSGVVNIGGVAGTVDFGTVKNCHSSGSVEEASGFSSGFGGVVGAVYRGIVENCYSSAAVSGSTKIGGVAGVGYISTTEGGTVRNCAALNPRLIATVADAAAGRVAGDVGTAGRLSHNYAFSGMTVNGQAPGAAPGAADSSNGADLSLARLYGTAPGFWTDENNWDTAEGSGWSAEIWTFEPGKLPILKGLPAGVQSGDGGLYLAERNLSGAGVSLEPASFTYNGEAQTPVPTVTFAGRTLAEGGDYTAAVTSADNSQTGSSGGVNAGEVTLTLTGQGNFTGTKTVTYRIDKAEPKASDLSYTPPSAAYDGSEHPAAVTAGPGVTGLGSITVKYNGGPDLPVDAGSWAVTADIAEGANYRAVSGLDLGSFTIGKASPPAVEVPILKIYRLEPSVGNRAELAALLPADRGTTEYSLSSGGGSPLANAAVEPASGVLTFDTVPAESTVVELVVQAKMGNYQDTDLTVRVSFVDKKVPAVTPSLGGSLSYGQSLSALPLGAAATADNGTVNVPGAMVWNKPGHKPAAGTGAQGWTFTPSNAEQYEIVTGFFPVTVNRTAPAGAPAVTSVQTGGKTLADAALTGSFANPYDGSPVPGVLSWDLADTAAVERGTAYGWTFIPEDTRNYTPRTGSVILYPSPNEDGDDDDGEVNPGGGSGGSPSSPARSGYIPPSAITQQGEGTEVRVTEEASRATPAQVQDLVRQNAHRPVVVRGAGYTITFPRGSLGGAKAREYDFGLRFDTGAGLGALRGLAGDSVTLMVSFNHSGPLPAEAIITFEVGAEHAGRTLHYYYFNEQTGNLEYLQSAVVAEDGTAAVRQSHCSDYIFTDRLLSGKHIAGDPERIAGGDRYGTAVAISKAYFTRGAETVVIARGDNALDALPAVPLAHYYGAPLLLTAPGGLPESVLEEIRTLGAQKAILIGGTGAIGAATEKGLRDAGLTVERIAGADRYDTAYAIAARLPQGSGQAVLVSGDQAETAFADALSVSSWAAWHGIPILYADSRAEGLPKSTVRLLREKNIERTVLVGGEGVIPARLEALAPNPVRYSGQDRYATNAALLKALQPDAVSVFAVSGSGFADALAGAAAAAQSNGWLLLTGGGPAGLTAEQEELLQGRKGRAGGLRVFGGPAAVPEGTLESMKELLGL